MAWLYAVTHKISGKVYVGWTSEKKINTRWSYHKYQAKKYNRYYIHNALNKYGSDAFNWEVIQYFDDNEEAKLNEIYWIARLKDFNIEVYNQTEGGDGITGWHHTEEHKLKMSKMMSGSNHPCFGKKVSPEIAKKSALARTGIKRSDETKEKLRIKKLGKLNPNFGKSPSEGTKQKQMVKKSGINNYWAKLDWDKVFIIRYLRSEGVYASYMAKQFSVDGSCVERVYNNKGWLMAQSPIFDENKRQSLINEATKLLNDFNQNFRKKRKS